MKIERKADPNMQFPSITICNINPLKACQLKGPFSSIKGPLEIDDDDMLYDDYIEDTLENWKEGECTQYCAYIWDGIRCMR